MQDSYVKEGEGCRKVVEEGDAPDPRITRGPTIQASYDTPLQHAAARSKCFDWIMEHAKINLVKYPIIECHFIH